AGRDQRTGDWGESLGFRGARSPSRGPRGVWLARRMGSSARLVLIGHVPGLSAVASLGPFARITLHLLAGRATLEPFVYIALHLRFRLLTRCGLSLLRHCREGNRASGNDNRRED